MVKTKIKTSHQTIEKELSFSVNYIYRNLTTNFLSMGKTLMVFILGVQNKAKMSDTTISIQDFTADLI